MVERNIEDMFLKSLRGLGYTYRDDIGNLADIEANFCQKFSALNCVNLTNEEHEQLLDTIISDDTFKCANMLRKTHSFERADGTDFEYTLVNTKDWCKNTFEVIRQPRVNTKYSYHQYDVVILMNGIPVVMVELKKHGISPRRAIEQIVEYKNDVGNGFQNKLMCFIQMFIVSNDNQTWYFANNNNTHFQFDAKEKFLPIYQFARADNTKVTNLTDFTEAFLPKCTLAKTISRYMVLVKIEQKMLMMRPYQVYAVQKIVESITNGNNGYIWHTTGSGKTLTSFKTSTLLKHNPHIYRCLFVVDRKDLDEQTREEFNKFQPNCVEQHTNTKSLIDRMLSDDDDDKIIVTTIQKLGVALNMKNTKHKNYVKELAPLKDKRMVFIFDECHRSQFGDNHEAIDTFFNNKQLFGFTGTPIFDENSVTLRTDDGNLQVTTKDIFQQQLHTYTISDAINDKNVLAFNVSHPKPAQAYDIEEDVSNDRFDKRSIVYSILEKHDALTAHRRFNALFATSSIPEAIEYYNLFQSTQKYLQKVKTDHKWLNIACVFSPPPHISKDVQQIQQDLNREKQDYKNKEKVKEKQQALEQIISDYCNTFGETHRIQDFDLYYQSVQQRIKNQKYDKSNFPDLKKIDITIVVDMLLTGFDSPYLNTLYVDKKLQYHQLIQAFSRTNRVLNDSKPHGNIIDYCNQQDELDEAITLFSDASKGDPRTIWLVDKADEVIDQFNEALQALQDVMQHHGLDCTPDQVVNLKGDIAQVQFLEKFKAVRRIKTRLEQYTDLTDGQTAHINTQMPQHTMQGFQGAYKEVLHQLRRRKTEPESDIPNPDTSDRSDPSGNTGSETDTPEPPTSDLFEDFDPENILFTSQIIDYDYIMALIANYTTQTPEEQEMSRKQLIRLIKSDAKFSFEDMETIQAYINTLELNKEYTESEIKQGFVVFRQQKTINAIYDTAEKFGVNADDLKQLFDTTLQRQMIDGDSLQKVIAPLNPGWMLRRKTEVALVQTLYPDLYRENGNKPIKGLELYE